jgi:Flp pilus assembly protein CpaB
LFESLRRAFRWHRRTFAALFAAVAVLAGLNTLASRGSDGVPVVVAAHTITGGATVTASDLLVVRVPLAYVPDGAFADPGPLIGRTAVVEMPSRTILVPSSLLGTDGAVAAGDVALPVRFGESATVPLLRVGGRIDVLGPSGGSEYGVVAANVRVVAVPAGGDGGLLGGGQSALVLLEVSSAQASAIAASAAVSSLSFALR